MIITPHSHCSIFFGNASTCDVSHKDKQYSQFCDTLRQQLGLAHFIRLCQVHGTAGLIIDDKYPLSKAVLLEENEGDFLVTNQSGVGIAVTTADCLPIVFTSPQHQLIAIAHAGWRGSLAGITDKVLQNIVSYSLDLSDVCIYFGPSARSCCYEVQHDFLDTIPTDAKDFVIKQDGKFFFDNSSYNRQQLIQRGILAENIHDQHNLCTMCDFEFHSYRRAVDKEAFKAQLTVAWLHGPQT